MISKKILVPTDFSSTAEHALKHAIAIAEKSGDAITVLHIKNNHSKKLLEDAGKQLEELESYLTEICNEVADSSGVSCQYQVVEGSIMSDINRIANHVDIRLMVIGTHGARGLRQNLFGSDMLKIAAKAPVPVLIIPDNCDVKKRYNKIVFPFGSHDNFRNKIDATAYLASLFDAEVHIYSIDRESDPPTKKTLNNIDEAQKVFDAEGVRYIIVHDDPKEFSIGYARQTMKYAVRIQADFVAVMSIPSTESHHFSNSDKEQFINNNEGMGLLMTSDY